MKHWLAGLGLLVCLVGPAFAGLDAASVNSADWQGKTPAKDKLHPAIVRLQVLLNRAGFSPGEIDGKLGENAVKALRAFAESKGLAVNGQQPVTPEIWNSLLATGSDPIIVEYRITEKDVKGPFLQKLPARMEDMQGLKSLDYVSPREAIAERFHMSEPLLEVLNPGKKFDEAGQTISVTNVTINEKATVTRIEVDKTAQTVKAWGKDGDLIAFFPASVGSQDKPTPSGTLKVTSIDARPYYRYNPDYKFKGVKATRAFEISPGPNNPVGSQWIGLSAEGIGIHGTANPSKVSKAESHGCVRLTNWDADRLAKLVKKGMEVAFVEQPVANRK